ncbi:MAG: hypothetical protein KGL39_05380 [Patescibacteria group bacterium]|nr:hypothetical protein [Patescibacteria group bacterium]
MSEEELQQLMQQHGGLAGATPIDPQVSVPDPIEVAAGISNPKQVKQANPNPTYRYVFKDGTSVEAKKQLDGSGKPTGNYDIVTGSTALKPVKGSTNAPITKSVGGDLYQYDPSTKQWNVVATGPTASKDAQMISVQNADGTISQVPATTAEIQSLIQSRQQNDAINQAKLQWQQAQDQIANGLKLKTLSLDQAKQAATEAYQKADLQMRQAASATTYADTLAKGLLSPGDMANINASIQSMGSRSSAPVQYQPLGGISPTLPMQLAQQAMNGSQASTDTSGAAPASVPAASASAASTAPSGYVAPSAAPAAAGYVAPNVQRGLQLGAMAQNANVGPLMPTWGQ